MKNTIRIKDLIGFIFLVLLVLKSGFILKLCRGNMARIRALIDFYRFSSCL